MALAEEERETCPSCGRPTAVCRNPEVLYTDLEVVEEECHFSRREAEFVHSPAWTERSETSQKATMIGTRFREGREPDWNAGLMLPPDDED